MLEMWLKNARTGFTGQVSGQECNAKARSPRAGPQTPNTLPGLNGIADRDLELTHLLGTNGYHNLVHAGS